MLRPRRTFGFFLALSFAFGLSRPAIAADNWPVPRGASHEPQPYTYDAKQLAKVPKDFLDDAAACILYAGNTYLVEPDGTIETITHDLTRLNGRKGIEKLGEYRNITYDPSYQKLTLNVARIHKADGRVREITPRHVQLRDVSTDYQVYDHEKQLIISFPSLEVGDVIEVKWTVRGKNPEHDGRFFTRYSFGDITYPVVLDELRVRLPKDMPFKYASVAGKVEPKVSEKDGLRLYQWKQDLCKRLPQDENMVSREELRPSVACSTFPSWEEVGKWKQKLRADCWTCTADVARVVEQVTKGLTDPTAKARALTYWLRRNVRYVSAGEKHDYTPHPPGDVLANRFGDCKDTSQLLAVMLAEAGLQVELATLGVLDDGQVIEAVPSPWGTHAILLVTIDGKQHWIDTTASLSGWDFLPHDDRDRLCYVVDRKGAIRLVRTPPLTAKDNRIEQVTHVWIGTDGATRNERTVMSYGSAAMTARDAYLEVPNGERRRQVANELLDSNSRTRLTALKFDEEALKDLDRPVSVRMGYEIGGHFAPDPDNPTNRQGSVTDSKVWGKLLAYNLDYDRETSVQYYAPFESDHVYVIHLPAAYYLDGLPQERSVKSAWGSFKLSVKTAFKAESVREVELHFQTRLSKTRVEKGDFDAFRKFHEDVGKYYRVWLTLKPVTDLSEAPLLEAVLAWAPNDAQTAVVLARLYQAQGKDADARRVLKRACAANPDEQTLWELAVKSAANVEEEEAADRELVRRFPDEPKYAIDLGAVLVTANKYDDAQAVLLPLTKEGSASLRAQAHYQLARAFYRKDDLKSALQQLDEATKADGDAMNTVKAYHLRGQVLEELGKAREALQAYQQALAIDRDSGETLEALVRLSLAQDKEAEALAYLRRYVLASNNDLNGLLKAADYYYRLKHYDEAFEVANRAREVRFHERTQRLLGLIHLRRGEYAKALFHLDKAEVDAVVAEGLLRASLELGDLQKVKERVETAKAEAAKQASAELKATLDRASRVLARRAELEKELPAPADAGEKWAAALDGIALAEEAYRDGTAPDHVLALLAPALAARPEVGAAYAWRGRLALEHGKLTAALDDAERAIRLSPKYADGYFVRGRVRQERGAKGALDDLKRAVELNHKRDAVMLHYLAEALYRDGQKDAALTAQRLAVKLKPQDKEIAEQLRQFEKEGGE